MEKFKIPRIQIDLTQLNALQKKQPKINCITSRAIKTAPRLLEQFQLTSRKKDKLKIVSKKRKKSKVKELDNQIKQDFQSPLNVKQIEQFIIKHELNPTSDMSTKPTKIQLKLSKNQLKSQTSPNSENVSYYKVLSSKLNFHSPQSNQISIVKTKLEKKQAKIPKEKEICKALKKSQKQKIINHVVPACKRNNTSVTQTITSEFKNPQEAENQRHRKVLSYKVLKPPELDFNDSRYFLKSIFEFR